MSQNHNFFSNLAFNIAENNLGKTKKNPSVGCVIVKDEAVVSSGFTSISGRPHAEFNALNKDYNFNHSYMYVTLEPCTHYGLTPPCTNIIKKKRLRKVYYCFDDPDSRTFKKAQKVLKNKIVKFKKIDSINSNFYQSYYINKKKRLPYIDAKIAVSKDFYTINKTSKWITNTRSRKVSHLIRSKYDTIISTSVSINKDNSLLNCRINGLDNLKPDLVIIDRKMSLKKKLKIFKMTKKRNIYIFTSSKNKKKINYFKKKNIKIIELSKMRTADDFKLIFKKLFKLGKRRILIESGLIFLNKLLEFKFINNLYLFKSGIRLNRKGYNNTRVNQIKKLKLNKKINVNLLNDELFKIRVI